MKRTSSQSWNKIPVTPSGDDAIIGDCPVREAYPEFVIKSIFIEPLENPPYRRDIIKRPKIDMAWLKNKTIKYAF